MSEMQAVRGLNAIPVIDAISRPARMFTGDFYFAHREENRTWIALGDVAGKGLPAAIVMAMIQEELEHRVVSCAGTSCDPACTMERLHEFLLPLMPSNRFATAVIAHLDDDGTLTIANGGHPPPLIVRNDGTIDALEPTGPVLGILPKAEWSSMKTHLAPGETIALYSDGVTESTCRGGEELGVEGLRAILSTTGTTDVLDQIGEVRDDVTLVVISRPRP